MRRWIFLASRRSSRDSRTAQLGCVRPSASVPRECETAGRAEQGLTRPAAPEERGHYPVGLRGVPSAARLLRTNTASINSKKGLAFCEGLFHTSTLSSKKSTRIAFRQGFPHLGR